MTSIIGTPIVRTAPGMEFGVSIAGDPDAARLLRLPPLLGRARLPRTPVLRLPLIGYAAGARPDPAQHANYVIDASIDETMAMSPNSGVESAGFISPGMTGVAAFRGRSPLAGPSGWGR